MGESPPMDRLFWSPPARAAYSHSASVGRRYGSYVDAVSFDEERRKRICAPIGEGVGLLPADAHHGVIVVAGMREIHPCVRLVVGVLKIVYPACSVGIDVHDIGVEKVVVAGERPGHGLSYNFPFVGEICGVFRDDREVGRCREVGVIFACGGVEPVFRALPRPCGCRFRNDS